MIPSGRLSGHSMIKDAKVAVIGGRDFTNYSLMKLVLDKYHAKYGISIIVSGGARGADTLAERWAKENQIDYHVFMAKWNLEGNRAGPRRNLRLVTYSQVVIAFPTENSVGTYNAISLAEKLGKKVYVIEPNSF